MDIMVGDLFDENDALKIFLRTLKHGPEGFHDWCVKEIVEPKKEHIEKIIGEFDIDYIAYMLEAATEHAKNEVIAKRGSLGGVLQEPQKDQQCSYWWPRKKKTNAGSSGTV